MRAFADARVWSRRACTSSRIALHPAGNAFAFVAIGVLRASDFLGGCQYRGALNNASYFVAEILNHGLSAFFAASAFQKLETQRTQRTQRGSDCKFLLNRT